MKGAALDEVAALVGRGSVVDARLKMLVNEADDSVEIIESEDCEDDVVVN